MGKETVLFCPLNWGLGHATRIVPLIQENMRKGNKIVIAADGMPYAFLKREFPDAAFYHFKSVKIVYLNPPFLFLGILLQMPLFAVSGVYEWLYMHYLVKKAGVTRIISDNRYGALHRKTHNQIITHQVFMKLPRSMRMYLKPLHWYIRKLLERFDEVLIPDYENIEESMAGELSHGAKMPAGSRYVGPLTRFAAPELVPDPTIGKFDIVVTMSGPEPYRSLFEKKMLKKYRGSAQSVLLILGKPAEKVQEQFDNVTRVSHLGSAQMMYVLQNCQKAVMRCGYTSVMDLNYLGVKNVDWSPTPKQTEQEYLYAWLNRK